MASVHRAMIDEHRKRATLGLRGAFGLGWAALHARYRLGRFAGKLFLIGAVLDPFIYAFIIYLVIAGIFERTGFDRFYFIVLGLISFRWTITCVLDGRNLTELRSRFDEVSGHPTAAALIVVTGPPTVVMALSLAAAVGVAHFGGVAAFSMAGWLWVVPVLITQGLWNLVLVLAVNRIRNWASERLFMVVAGLLWLLSPTFYKFGDISPAASAIFTTYNPVSHILAGYYNALWFGLPISLRVLPIAGVVGFILLLWLAWRRSAPDGGPRVDSASFSDRSSPFLVVVESVGGAGDIRPSFGPECRIARLWSGRLNGLTGRDVARLISHARGADDSEGEFSRIAGVSKLGRLFDDRVSLYPDRALAQLAFAMAVADDDRPLVLDGILDSADRVFVAEAWQRLVAIASKGRRVVIVTYNLLVLPPAAKGAFVAISGGQTIESGCIETDLAAFYEKVMVAGTFPRDRSCGS